MSRGAGRSAPVRPAAELARVLRALCVGDVRPRLLDVTRADARSSCQVLDAKYSPGRSCTVLYGVGPQLVSGEVELRGPDVPVRLTAFPDDPGLPALRALVDPSAARDLLTALADEEGGRALTGTASLLRYRSGRRATVRLSGRLRRRSGSFRQVAYVVKLYHDAGKASAVAAEGAQLERSRPVREGAVRTAPLVGFLPALPAVAWAVADGVPLDLVLAGSRGSRRAEEAVRRAGAGLAGLHVVPGVSERRRPAEEELAKYVGRAARAAAVAPDLGARLLAVLDGLGARRDLLEHAGEGLLHGDCKPSQFLVSDEGVTVLDLDSCRRGDPASDLGSFLATLRQRDVHAAQAAPRRRPLAPGRATQFLDGYCEALGADQHEAQRLRVRAAWFEALSLQRKALRAFARAPRSPVPAALAASAEAVLADLDRRRT